jgi:hypothetical protein
MAGYNKQEYIPTDCGLHIRIPATSHTDDYNKWSSCYGASTGVMDGCVFFCRVDFAYFDSYLALSCKLYSIYTSI